MLYRSRPAPECGERSYSVFRCRRRTGEDGAQRLAVDWRLSVQQQQREVGYIYTEEYKNPKNYRSDENHKILKSYIHALYLLTNTITITNQLNVPYWAF